MLRLSPPPRNPRGPDGQGWNRLAVLLPDAGTQCAMRPRTYEALVEVSRGSRFATYGHYGRCTTPGSPCDGCDQLKKQAPELLLYGEKFLVRTDDAGRPWIMNRPDRGWAESSTPTSFHELAALPGYKPGTRYQDGYGPGFWMLRG